MSLTGHGELIYAIPKELSGSRCQNGKSIIGVRAMRVPMKLVSPNAKKFGESWDKAGTRDSQKQRVRNRRRCFLCVALVCDWKWKAWGSHEGRLCARAAARVSVVARRTRWVTKSSVGCLFYIVGVFCIFGLHPIYRYINHISFRRSHIIRRSYSFSWEPNTSTRWLAIDGISIARFISWLQYGCGY